MRYMGSKARLAKHIAPILESYRVDDGVYIKPFVGGGNMITHATGNRIGFDSNPYVIDTLDALSKGWLPKPTYSEEEYRIHASLARNNDLSQSHITGWLGFACSFSGKFFGGFARSAGRDLCNEQYRSLLKKKDCTKTLILHSLTIISYLTALTILKTQLFIAILHTKTRQNTVIVLTMCVF